MEPPIVCGIFYLDVARDLTWQLQAVDRTKDSLEEWMTCRDMATELEELVALGPLDCCVRHPPQNFEED